MRSRKQTPLPLEAPLRVRLTDDARARKAHELAVIGLSIRGHKRKLSNDARETKQEIARLEKDRAELEDQLIADEEMRPQGELFVGNTPSKEEAAAALGKVAVVAGEVRPSDPHAFEAVGGAGLPGQMCKHCGSGQGDPVHAPAAHDFLADGAVEGVCSLCGGPKASLVHGKGSDGAAVPAPAAGAAKAAGNGKGNGAGGGHKKPAPRGKQGKAARP
jgi:hypothetical protein